MDLIIYAINGTTMRFQQVKDFKKYDDCIKFSYFGVATNMKRNAEFYRKNILGYALSENGEEQAHGK